MGTKEGSPLREGRGELFAGAPKSGAGASEFAGLGGEGYKLPPAEYAPKYTSNTPC